MNWKFFFGALLLITIGFSTMILLSLNRDRGKLQAITKTLIEHVNAAKTNEERMQVIADSLALQISYLDSNLHMLEAQKDSLLRGIKRPVNKQSKKNNELNKLGNLEKTEFVVTTQEGTVIDPQTGIRAGALKGFRVSGGPKIRVNSMDVILVRGLKNVQELTVTSSSVDISAWSSQLIKGDALHLVIKRIRKISSGGAVEEVTLENERIIIPVL